MKRTFSPRDAWPWLGRFALAGVMVWAAVPKLIDPATFVTDIQNYRVLPPEAARFAAAFLPAAELVAGLGLLLPRVQRGAALVNAAMLFVFAAAMTQARLRGIDLRCGCFGAAFEAEVSWWTVVRSGGLGSLALLLAFPWRAARDAANVQQSGAGQPPVP